MDKLVGAIKGLHTVGQGTIKLHTQLLHKKTKQQLTKQLKKKETGTVLFILCVNISKTLPGKLPLARGPPRAGCRAAPRPPAAPPRAALLATPPRTGGPPARPRATTPRPRPAYIAKHQTQNYFQTNTYKFCKIELAMQKLFET